MRTLRTFLLCLVLATASAQQLYVNDSGTWREIEEVHVNDAGTWREIKEIYVNDSGTWRLVFRAFGELSCTLTAANFLTVNSGYSAASGAGSMSSTTVGDGQTVVAWYDSLLAGSVLVISGFAADPGQDWFTTATYDGTSKSAASASYNYSAGTATWSWGSVFGFAANTGVAKTCGITK